MCGVLCSHAFLLLTLSCCVTSFDVAEICPKPTNYDTRMLLPCPTRKLF